jgi:hypothetical protein
MPEKEYLKHSFLVKYILKSDFGKRRARRGL